jgi:hypothetical protein
VVFKQYQLARSEPIAAPQQQHVVVAQGREHGVAANRNS